MAALVAAACLGGCSVPNAINPVAWYRGLSGADKNDALDADQRNQQNLEAGGKEPYPNLGDVPNAPDNALSEKNRDALTKSLAADRSNAQYTDDQLRAGAPPPGTVAPPPPAPAVTRATPPNTAAAATAKPSGPAAPPPAVTSPPSAPAAEAAAAPPKPAPRTAVTEAPVPPPAPAAPLAAAPASAAPPSAAPPPAKPPPAAKEEAPQESSLATPTIAKLPEGETPAPPPPRPNLVPSPVAANRPPPNAVASIASGKVRESSSSVAVASIAFTAGSATLSERERNRLSEVAAMQHQQGGAIRVVGHAEPAKGGDLAQQELASLRLALNRAKAVAQALGGEGVASQSIDVEAAPIRPGDSAAASTEIYLEH
jgi:outer membrane protein OmpA-like peptidoglycan-associated protein